MDSVKTQTIREFMSILDSQIQNQNAPVFARSSTPTLSPPQLKFLENLPTVMVFSCLQKFIQWLKDGMYDFHTLPFTLKTHLPLEDQEALLQIPEKWKGGKSSLWQPKIVGTGMGMFFGSCSKSLYRGST